jgi:predicted CxxxxCH...CXXCH cytochrome family protein
MTGGGALIASGAGGKHLNGVVEAAGGGHAASWMDKANAGFHAFSANADLAACQGCHGTNLDGVGGSATTSCATCHGASWKTNCTMCHGGTANATGAPPKAIWGQAGDPLRGGGTADPVRAGAHGKHVTDGGVAKAFACDVCHVKPSSATSPGHLDGPAATVLFAGVSLTGGVAPIWNRASATCSATYCHGGYTGGNSATPVWTQLDGTWSRCGSCHGLPPGTGYPIGGPSAHEFHTTNRQVACARCHSGYTITTIDPAQHVNGTKDVLFQYYYPDPANPDQAAACNAPTSYTVQLTGWDCAGCHNYKNAWANYCCSVVACY